MRRLVKFIASFCYAGYSPVVPGTIGSLAGLVVYFLVRNHVVLYAFSTLFLLVLGFMFSGEAEKIYKKKDAKTIVIDEACGMLLALFLVPSSLPAVIAGFLLFRFFDVIKPPPARRVEELLGSRGVMLDDILAASYTNVILQLLFRVLRIMK
jgi:phosphatidylglycerophosphatase A